MAEWADFALGLLILWVFFFTGMAIWNNPFSYEEVREAEKEHNGPWPKE